MTKADHSPGAPAFRVPSSLGLVNKESGAPVKPRHRKSVGEIRITVPTDVTPQQIADRLGWEFRERTVVEPSPWYQWIVPLVLLCAAIVLDTAVLVAAIVGW